MLNTPLFLLILKREEVKPNDEYDTVDFKTLQFSQIIFLMRLYGSKDAKNFGSQKL